MKKLKLSLQNMEGVEVLTRAQLKNVMGGTGGDGSTSGAPKCDCNSKEDCGSDDQGQIPCGANCDSEGTSKAGVCGRDSSIPNG